MPGIEERKAGQTDQVSRFVSKQMLQLILRSGLCVLREDLG